MHAPAITSIELPTGRLDLQVHDGPPVDALCAFAARANPKRGFLVVSRILGRHIPARPAEMRGAMDALAAKISATLPQPILFVGMAETATALGKGIFAGFRALHPRLDALYLQTSRQHVDGARLFCSFEEGHSHATTHLVQLRDAGVEAVVRRARSLVIVDDECSTGGTFVAAATALAEAMPALERIETCCITDWSDGAYLPRMPRPTQGHALLSGAMTWQAGASVHRATLAAATNNRGSAPPQGMQSRLGLRDPEAAIRGPITVRTGERVLLLGDGEHSYEALRAAEEIEAQGGIAAVQCITRTPALLGGAMASVSSFHDSYGSEAPCFLYNILGHRPDRIIILGEVEAGQRADAEAALRELGAAVPVEFLLCAYARPDGPA